MTKKKDETRGEIVTESYRGPDRRKPDKGNGEAKPKTRVWFDEEGNPLVGFIDDAPRRRVGDDTLDYLEALDPDSLPADEDE